MKFNSILFLNKYARGDDAAASAPKYFRDLNLDQIVDAITADRKQYQLDAFFYTPLKDKDAVLYRQEVMDDIQEKSLIPMFGEFSARMAEMRSILIGLKDIDSTHASQRRFLAAAEVYCDAAAYLLNDLDEVELRSTGLIAFRVYLSEYINSVGFAKLVRDISDVKSALSSIRYSLRIDSDEITVAKGESENDFSLVVEETFEKFRRETINEIQLDVPRWSGMNRIDARVLERLALLFPDQFLQLDQFRSEHANYLETTIERFDREIQFYVAYLSYIEGFERVGLRFCRPTILDEDKQIQAVAAFDLALAAKLFEEGESIVTNDLRLNGRERIFVVTGPNHGGKTTFARMFGQLHYLASLGCPVPSSQARLCLFDQMFTHFERQESAVNLRGKLQDDLLRMHKILSNATSDSIVILNELFSSTTLDDAVLLSDRIMKEIVRLDLIGVWVTFLDELASSDEKVVSVAAIVDPDDLAVRTFKLDRQPANGLAYALAIAEKHRVTYNAIKERVGP